MMYWFCCSLFSSFRAPLEDYVLKNFFQIWDGRKRLPPPVQTSFSTGSLIPQLVPTTQHLLLRTVDMIKSLDQRQHMIYVHITYSWMISMQNWPVEVTLPRYFSYVNKTLLYLRLRRLLERTERAYLGQEVVQLMRVELLYLANLSCGRLADQGAGACLQQQEEPVESVTNLHPS